MTTVVNNPGNTDGTGAGLVVGVILAIAVIALLFFVYGLPAIRGTEPATPAANTVDVNLKLPAGNTAPQQ